MDEIQFILQEISSKQIEAQIKSLAGIRHPVVAPEALEKAADFIWTTLKSYGYDMSVHHFSEDERTYRNIIGTQLGAQQPDKRILVIAHYDTVSTSPGANDNASGVAAMLELARVLRQFKFSKSIQFVGVNLEEQKVDGEKGSPTLRGSRALANFAREEGWEIEGVVNFEEIAFAGETIPQSKPKNLPVELPAVGNFIAVIGNEISAELVKGYIQAIQKYQIPLPYVPLVVPGNGEMLPDTRRSDHAPFWDNGYRAIMLTDTAEFRTPHYHKSGDVIDTLNLSFASEVCRAAGGLVFNLAGYG